MMPVAVTGIIGNGVFCADGTSCPRQAGLSPVRPQVQAATRLTASY
jgi:hypothetical protein